MSATSYNDPTGGNPISGLENKGEFSSRVKLVEHFQEIKSAPNKNKNAPEFYAEQYPPGTASAKDTYKSNPDPVDDVPGLGMTAPSDTLGGTSSLDVDCGLGKPGSGQSNKELHDNTRGRQGGVEGVGGKPLQMPDEPLDRELNK